MGNITFFVIFAVLDVSLDVNLCINCSFFTFITIMNAIRKWSGWLALSIPDTGYSADKQHRGNGSGRRNYFIV